MRKELKELSSNELFKVIVNNTHLNKKLDDYIQETEMYWIDDLMNVLESGLSRWSIGFYNQNFIERNNNTDFLNSVDEFIRTFSCDAQLKSMYNRCKKLHNKESNLLDYYVDKLQDLVLDELNTYCEDVEDLSYQLYIKNDNYNQFGYDIDWFIENLDGYTVDENGVIYHEQIVS